MIAWIEANIVFAWLLWLAFVAGALAWLARRERRRGLDISEAERRWREKR